jgi:branched-subunit amino acid ABC-type transport system permease component
VSIILGRENKYVGTPLTGEWNVAFGHYSSYRLFLVIVAGVLFAVLWFVTHKTRLGLIARAVIANETLAATHGIDCRRVSRWTFMVGSGLAALAGALVAPIGAVQPNMGQDYLVDAFMVVMVAYSSVGGLLVAALLFGAAESWVTFLTSPIVGNITIIVLTAVTLRILPQGFTALKPPGGLPTRRMAQQEGPPTPSEDESP